MVEASPDLRGLWRAPHQRRKCEIAPIVDYWGLSEALQEALVIFAPSDVRGAMTPTRLNL
jgi:hypothetical protein